MPLDPSIFMQGAAMSQRQNEALLNSLSNSIQNAQAMKLKKQELAQGKGFDLEKLAGQALVKREMGEELSPQETGVLKAYDTLQTRKMAVDPVTGGYYKPNASIFEGQPRYNSMARPVDQPQNVGFDFGNIPAMDSLDAPIPTGGKVPLQPLNVDMIEASGDPALDARRQEMFAQNQAMQNNGFDLGGLQPKIEVPKELRGNPKAEQKYLESAAGELAKSSAERQGETPKAAARISDFVGKMKNLNQTLDEAISMVGPTTAGIGSNLKDVPIVGRGTKSKDLDSLLNTIRADAAFSELQTMRDNSPTGGALGQVSERELALLTSAAAALDQEQSPQQLRKNLLNYKRIRNESLKRVSEAYEQTYGRPAPMMESDSTVNAGWSIRKK